MVPTFNGQPIFGFATKTTSPAMKPRVQQERLPGVRGFRLYILADRDSITWNIRGRLSMTSIAQISNAVLAAQNLMAGLYTFVDAGGTKFTNCQLTDFRPLSSQYTRVIDPVSRFTGYTIEVSATVVCADP